MSRTASQIIVNVTVSGGIGSVAVNQYLGCVGIGIKSPNAQASFDIDLTDPDGMGIFGYSGLKGTNTIQANFQMFGPATLTISNATVDGTYMVKLWCSWMGS